MKILNPGFYFILSEEGGIGLNFKFAFNTNGEKSWERDILSTFVLLSTSFYEFVKLPNRELHLATARRKRRKFEKNYTFIPIE